MEEENYDEEKSEDKLDEEKDYGEADQSGYESTISDETEHTTRVLTHAEAGECLYNLGKCEGDEYAYLSLDASDRDLTDIGVIPSFKYVRYVNVSGNRLTSEALRALEAMPYLQTLRADRNRLTSAELKPMPYLQELALNQNKLTDTSGIHHTSLERLELKHNDIRTVDMDPRILASLRTLELRGNALVSTAGICCPSLTRLFLAENQIEKIEDFGTLVNLKTLHLRSNRLANLDGFTERCRSLNYVNLRDNELPRISELRKLDCLPNLETLIVLGNPLLREEAKEEEGKEYRRVILAMLPKLKRIDKDPVLDQERNEAKALLQKIP
ncbi:PREDICTED: leucine-rich repeat-containing protein 23-like [Wasmannia auropunctata]|uniref:leucine-rich repeat-containing protein 23-like n=1 Tax=Wasmannia auropunctata TaxID=64793 RepID=UPI0005EE3671|nr:PREDICTED: leucine-rich repeat-containing protein 23-like [Wasmannia auropunctata]XP_011685919.1 PREDICTED: leucine-rich repeat-containing protein 23-like [Wasmannia auropunctata]XP_011685920.1 PREDICTED: leucine-rich repeat-containing protein 23-like [Wasmannia auropunctata]